MSRNRWDEPAQAVTSPPPPAAAAGSAGSAAEAAARAAAIAAKLTGSVSKPLAPKPEVHDEGAFVEDIEINDLRNRYLLTKGSTQQQIHTDTGASVTTKGVWLPDKSKASASEPPLYLHVVATTKEILDTAIAKINELINQDLGALVEDRSQWARNRERFGAGAPVTGANAAPAGGSPLGGGEGGEGGDQAQALVARGSWGPNRGGAGLGFGGGGGPGGPPERRKWPEEKVMIGLESLRNFNVRAKVVGPGGMFVKHIQNETGTRVQIKGQGSGYYEVETGREGEDPMHISIAGPDEGQIERAKALAEDLLLVVRSEWQKARDANMAPQGYGGYPQNAAQAYYAQQAAYAQQMQQAQQQPAPPSGEAPPPPPADGSAPQASPSGAAPAPGVGPDAAAGAAPGAAPGATAAGGDDAQEAYRKYWAAYGYDVNDPAFQAWQAQQYGYSGAGGGAAPAPGADPAAAVASAGGAAPPQA